MTQVHAFRYRRNLLAAHEPTNMVFLFRQKEPATLSPGPEKPAPAKLLTDPEPIIWNVLPGLVILMVLTTVMRLS